MFNSIWFWYATHFPYTPARVILSFVFCYSQTCFRDDLSTRTTFFVSLENGFSLKHVLKELVYKDHLSTKTTCLQRPLFVFPLGSRYRQVWLYLIFTLNLLNSIRQGALKKNSIKEAMSTTVNGAGGAAKKKGPKKKMALPPSGKVRTILLL